MLFFIVLIELLMDTSIEKFSFLQNGDKYRNVFLFREFFCVINKDKYDLRQKFKTILMRIYSVRMLG